MLSEVLRWILEFTKQPVSQVRFFSFLLSEAHPLPFEFYTNPVSNKDAHVEIKAASAQKKRGNG